MEEVWRDKKWLESYIDIEGDRAQNRFETTINIESVLNLIPKNAETLLDYGCCGGFFTQLCTKQVPGVFGYDISEYAREIAADNASDAKIITKNEMDDMKFGVVILKLVIHFVEDLDDLVKYLKKILDDKGTVIVSTAHPMKIVLDAGVSYGGGSALYEDDVSNTKKSVTMVYRSIEDNVKPFLENGFVVDALEEIFDENRSDIPKRLNIRYRLV